MGLGKLFVSLPKINTMEVHCLKCGKAFKVKPSKAATRKYCGRVCSSKKVTRPCDQCGKEVTRPQSQMFKKVYCCLTCSRIGLSEAMTAMNLVLNPDRMTLSTRTKLRRAHLGKGSGKAYRKTFGRHTHRLVASEKIGRALRRGEVVHHIDGNILNNDPENLQVLTSQAEHINLHREQLIKSKQRC